jgi:hypothetical protein
MKTRKIGLVNYLAYGSGDFLGRARQHLPLHGYSISTPPSAA